MPSDGIRRHGDMPVFNLKELKTNAFHVFSFPEALLEKEKRGGRKEGDTDEL